MNVQSIEITPEFIGVTVNGKKAGQVIFGAAGWLAQTNPPVGEVSQGAFFNDPESGVNWVANNFKQAQS